jgi:ribose 5-phosphate isomerase B
MSRVFDIITEADARQLDVGAVVELAAGGHVTPLARDTLKARRVTVVPAGSSDASLPADLAPVADIRRVAIASDHTGVELKSALVQHMRGKALAVEDVWPSKPAPVDYPDVAAAVGRAVARGEADAGIVIDGAGLGSTIAANKIRGVRAAMCTNVTLARYAREHNGANVLALGATLITIEEAKEIVDTWLATPMREARYVRRLLKIRRLESADGR